MRILVTNDDGIYSPGLVALAESATAFGDVRVVAPDVEQSSMGHAITSSRPLSYRPAKLGALEAYRVNGTPADCVALGAYHWERVDVVLSGINLGSNLGNSVWHSGTLAAAKQAALLGLRGIALSTPAGKIEPAFDRLHDPMGRKHYWFTITAIEETEEGTDRWAVRQGWVSITPLRLDLTDEDQLAQAQAEQPLG